MIDWKTYDPAKDACEEESHLCNSLNAEMGMLRYTIRALDLQNAKSVPIAKDELERLADYLERSQAVITYLEKKVKEYE